MLKYCLLLSFCFNLVILEARLPSLTPKIVTDKTEEILKAHASYKKLDEELIKRILQNYLEEIDPYKTYFIESDIEQWLNPTQDLIKQVLTDYQNSKFPEFKKINEAMVKAIYRRRNLEKQIDVKNLPKHVSSKEFKDLKWAKTEQGLVTRLTRIKALQLETSEKLTPELREKALQRLDKRQLKYEDEFLAKDPIAQERLMLSDLLKATASSLDTHTSYFTPDEAEQFMISVQQRLFGIGAQLRDDLNGFSVVKVIEGGPAANGKELKAKDRIIAVNGEPVVGMDIEDAVELIRGEENTPVTLTVIREVKEDDKVKEEKKDIVIKRGEVVLKESRYNSDFEPFGNGIIAHLKLFTFYQDQESSSADDLTKAIKELKDKHQLKGVVLDLRYNTGGLLSQAVEVAGLFITKGVIVSIKDNTGAVQHLRDLDGKTVWDGPLIVLVNRASASASEIVAQALQDYGRALIVGDDHTYGKGSFQTFTLNTTKNAQVLPEGEYKVTRGRYYTVSGKTPQLVGVLSDIVIPGTLSQMEIGEKYAKYPLENDKIKDNFDDDLSDVPFTQRAKIRLLYKFDLQKKLDLYKPYIEVLQANTNYRMEHDKDYQTFLKQLKKDQEEGDEMAAQDAEEEFGKNDLQLIETYNVMKDLLYLMTSTKTAG